MHEDILDRKEDHDDSGIAFGYEMDVFVVSKKSVDNDCNEDVSDSDRILYRAESTSEIEALPFSTNHY